MRVESTQAEEKLWQHLRNRQVQGLKFRRQHAIDRYIVDFYCPEARLVIEVDGPIHEFTQDEDTQRQLKLEERGLRVLRFTNDQVLSELKDVLSEIAESLKGDR